MPRSLLPAALGAALAVATVACRDATATRAPLVATYELRTVDGSPLPVVTSSSRGADGGLETVTLLEERYAFAADGSVRLTGRVRLTSARAPRDTVTAYLGELAYVRTGDRLTIAPRTPCPPNAICLAAYEARLVGGSGLVVETVGAPTARRREYGIVR